MPVQLNENKEVTYRLDDENEIEKPLAEGHYLEVIARLDAYIDSLLDALLRKKYSTRKCQRLIDSFERALSTQTREFFSGVVRLKILVETEKSSKKKIFTGKNKDLPKRIFTYKEKRNLILHSPLGHHNLVDVKGVVGNDDYQNKAADSIKKTVALGRECYGDIKKLVSDD